LKEYITGAQFGEMIICATDALQANMQTINELNVFPVPDGDTGTNMTLTMTAAANEMRAGTSARVDDTANKAASALLRGARGNSGVILSLLFRGISKGLKGCENAGALEFAAAMCDGVDAAYKAIMKPTEGTILTVSRVATKAAFDYAKAEDDVEGMLAVAIEAGRDALALTVEQNPVLRRAGVVDAGGMGYVLVLDAMLACLEGRAIASEGAAILNEKADFSAFDVGEITFGYCTEFIVNRENEKSPDVLRAFCDSLGDSLVLVADEEIIKVHVHTNEPGRALTEALTYGALLSVKIENMREQHTELGGEAAAPSPPEDFFAPAEKKYGFVAICAGGGMESLFRDLGADGVVTGGQTMNPSTEDILREVNRTPSEIVYVFPNNKNIILAAEQCVALTEKKVIIIPSVTVPQGITAMLGLDTYAEEDALTATFKDALSHVHTAMITYAARDSEYDGAEIHAGEFLGLFDGALLGSDTDLSVILQAICERMGELEPEFISVYYGEDVDAAAAEATGKLIEKRFSDADVSVVDGGQPVYYYMISAE